ncbi:MAG: LD-carboxypeptidase [Acidobacteriaceae bacterium]|nr:LD-carboxypeptidase [Acidobacteriaceae bacterium]
MSTKPKALRKGARLAVVSPASTPQRALVEKGAVALRELGYEPVLYPHVFGGGPLYYAGTAAERVNDLHAAFADKTIDGIIAARGGWGTAELLPLLDTELIRANPKVFIGYSDHTSLHTYFQTHCNLNTFYAPMVAADFARENGVDWSSWCSVFEGASEWSLTSADGLRVLRPGKATGVLRGGCISILAQSLGTPWAAETGNSILFLEDIGTKPYQWDRILLHLRWAGRLDTVRGIVFGDMKQCVIPEDMELLEDAIQHSLRDFAGPVAIGLRSGHVSEPNISLPLGISCSLDCSSEPQLNFLESAVV